MNIFAEVLQTLKDLVTSSGFATSGWENYVMIVIACVLMYLAIKKEYEPLLLLPIAFGMLLVNVFPNIMAAPTPTYDMVEMTGQTLADYLSGAYKSAYPVIQ